MEYTSALNLNSNIQEDLLTTFNACYVNESMTKEDIIFGVYYSVGIVIICLICFVGNGLILHAILYYDHLRQIHNWFILSLAISDILQGITIPFYTMGHSSKLVILEGLADWKLCQFMVINVCAPQTVSAYNIVGITVVRFLAIKRPLSFMEVMVKNKHVSVAIIALIWLLGYGVSVALYLKPQQPDRFCGICRTELIYDLWQIVVFIFLNILIPVAIMVVLYYCSIRIISKRKKHLISSSTRGTSLMQRETKIIKVVSTLLGFYTVSWLPFLIYEFFIVSCTTGDGECGDFRYFRATSRLFYFSNVAVNVFIYAGRSNDFRYALELNLYAIKQCFGIKHERRHNYFSALLRQSLGSSPAQARSSYGDFGNRVARQNIASSAAENSSEEIPNSYTNGAMTGPNCDTVVDSDNDFQSQSDNDISVISTERLNSVVKFQTVSDVCLETSHL